MIEAYSIGVTLKLRDQVGPQLLKLGELFKKTDLQVVKLNESLRHAGAESAALRSVASAGEATSRALAQANDRVLTLGRNLTRLREAGSLPGMLPMGGTRVVPGNGGGGRYGGRGGGHFHGGNAHINSGGVGVGGVGFGMSADLLPAMAVGYAGVAGTKALYESAKDFNLEFDRFRALGLGDNMNAEALRFVKNSKTFGVSQAQMMAMFRDAQTVFRDSGTLHHAESVLPVMARMRLANEYFGGAEHAGNMEGKFLDMLRVIELRKGLNSPSEFMRQANMVQQVITTSGGRVDATQYLNLLKTGGVAAKGLSNEALYYQLEPIIQEMGGQRVGTGLMSAYQNLMLGRTSVQVAKELGRLGLLDEKHVEYNKIGMIKRILPGGLKGGDVLAKSPVDYLEKVLLPAFRAKGITSEEQTLQELGLIFSNRTASNLFSTMYQQLPQIRKGEQMSKSALSINQAYEMAKKGPQGAETEFIAAWTDFKKVFGESVLPKVSDMLQNSSALIRAIGQFAENHKDMLSITDKVATLSNPVSTFSAAVTGIRKLVQGESPFVKPGAATGAVAPHSHPIVMDGRKVAEGVSAAVGRASQSKLLSGYGVDYSMLTPQPGNPPR